MFTTIKPSDANYAAINAFMTENAGAFDYNGLVAHLNEQEVGSVVQFPFRKGKLGQIRHGLEARGLKNGVDFTVSGGLANAEDENSEFLALVKKGSDKAGVPVVAKPRGRAAQKAADGAAAPAADAKPAKGKK